MEQLKYKIFDMIKKEDFDRAESDEILTERLAKLETVRNKIEQLGITTIDIVEQIQIRDEDHLNEMMEQAIRKGWEGLIVRRNVPYKGKRSNDLLKVKEMHDAEYVINSIETGPFRIISKETGLEVEEDMMTKLVITHKGNKVGVGSGFTLDERRAIMKDPSLVIGRTMTVKYFEETVNKKGENSLRFPIKKMIYNGDRDV